VVAFIRVIFRNICLHRAGRETRTLPVAVYNMISFDQLSWGPLAAAALIVTFPVLLLTVLAQRQIVAGLTAGAVKGG
jgi:multiple sugar transport system permease protein